MPRSEGIQTIKLNPADLKAAAGVFARAFNEYPMMTFIWPDPARKQQHFDWYSECAINYGLRYGEVFTTPDLEGISMWLPPSQPYLTISRAFQVGFSTLGIRMGIRNYIDRNLKNEIATTKAHKACMPCPHWYLWVIVVDPPRQAQGIGTALLQPGLKLADQSSLPCYLETHDEKNLPFYQRNGFEVLRTELVPGSSLRFWCLKHKPFARA